MSRSNGNYHVFHRVWWQESPDWPNGLEPWGGAPKSTIGYARTVEEAQYMCREWCSNHPPGRYSDKAEYEES